MAPKRRRTRGGRKGRRGRRQEFYINVTQASFTAGVSQAFVADATMQNRGYRPRWVEVQATSLNGPTLVQVRLYDKDGNSVMTGDPFLVNVTTIKRRYHFPPSLDPIPTGQSHTYCAVDSICTRKTDQNICYLLVRCGSTLAHETLPEACPALGRVIEAARSGQSLGVQQRGNQLV